MNIVGWREWLSLPDLGVDHIKVKIDTGARTSALHAERIEIFELEGREWVRFLIYPLQKSRRQETWAEAPLIEHREIRSSVGTLTRRPVIETLVEVGHLAFPIELTLVNRHMMGFRMLLGRKALENRLLVDCTLSYNQGPRP